MDGLTRTEDKPASHRRRKAAAAAPADDKPKNAKAAAKGAEGFCVTMWMDPDKLVLEDDPAEPMFDDNCLRDAEEWLVDSLDEVGQIHNVTYRIDGEHPDGTPRCVVVDGRKRTLAGRELKRRRREAGLPDDFKLFAVHKDVEDADAVWISEIANNHHRADTEAQRLRRYDLLKNKYQEPRDRLLKLFKTTRHTLERWDRVLGCDASVQEAFAEGWLPHTVVPHLMRLRRSQQAKVIAEVREGGRLTGPAVLAALGVTEDKRPNKRTMNRIEKAALAARGKGGAALSVIVQYLRRGGDEEEFWAAMAQFGAERPEEGDKDDDGDG